MKTSFISFSDFSSSTLSHSLLHIALSPNPARTVTVSHSGNSLDKLRHPRSDAYSAEQVLLNKQLIWCGGAYLDCYRHSY